MKIKKIFLIFGFIFLISSCDSVVESKEFSLRCINSDSEMWHIDIDLDLRTGNYSRYVTETVSRVEYISDILITPRTLLGFNQKEEQIFVLSREQLTITINEGESVYVGGCINLNRKINRKI